MSRSMFLSLMIALTAGCTPNVLVVTYQTDPATPSDDDDSTEAPADDDDSALVEEGCDLYLPEDPWTNPACFAPTGVIPQVSSLHDGNVVQIDIGGTPFLYYVLHNQRHHIPTLQRFTSWYGQEACEACAGVVEVTDPAVVAALPIGQDVTARPGTIIGIQADTSLFVIDRCRTARAILPSVAAQVYGEGWNEYLVNFPNKPEVFFTGYAMGSPVESMSDFDLTAALDRTIDEEILGIGCEEEPEFADSVELEIYFSTAWSSSGPTQATPNSEPAFGTYMLHAVGDPYAQVDVTSLGLILATKSSSENTFEPWGTGSGSAQEYISFCVLRTQPSGEIIAGPAVPNGADVVNFGGFSLVTGETGEIYLPLQVTCGFNSEPPVGGEDGFAVLWESSSFYALDANGNQVWWEVLADNGSWANPTVQIWLVNEPPVLVVSLHSASPSGASVPQEELGVLMFNVEAVGADIEMSHVGLWVNTSDNEASGWNSCDILGDAISGDGIELFSVTNMSTDLGLFGASSTGQPCANPANGELPVTWAANGWFNWIIPEGTVATFVVTADTSGASTSANDTIQMDLESVMATDTATGLTVAVQGLTLWGGTLVF